MNKLPLLLLLSLGLIGNSYADDAEAKALDIKAICSPPIDLEMVKTSVEHLEVETKTLIKKLEVERKALIKQLEELRIENNKNLSDINNVKLNIYLLSIEIDEADQSLEDLQEDLHSQQESLELCKQDPEAWQARFEALVQKLNEDSANVIIIYDGPEGYITQGGVCIVGCPK